MKASSRFFVKVATIFSVSLSVSAAAAFEPSNEAEKLLVSWLEESDCSLAQSDFVKKVLSGAGLPGSQMMQARRAMTRSGFIRRTENNGMTLVAGSVCDNVEIPEPDFSSDSERDVAATKLMAVFEKNGCVASQRNVMRLAKADGMTEQQIDIAGEALEDAGGFTETDDGLQLMFGKCKGATPDINAQYKSGVKTLETEGKLAVIVRIFEENECTLTQEKATSLFAEEGIESSEVRGLVKPLMNEGHLVPRDDAVMLVSGEVCG